MYDFSDLEHLFEAGDYAKWMEQVKQHLKEYKKGIDKEVTRLIVSGKSDEAKTVREQWEKEKLESLLAQLERIFNAGEYTAWMTEVGLCLKENSQESKERTEKVNAIREEIEKNKALWVQELKKDNFFNRIFKKAEVEKARENCKKYDKKHDSLAIDLKAAITVAEKVIKESQSLQAYSQKRVAEIQKKM